MSIFYEEDNVPQKDLGPAVNNDIKDQKKKKKKKHKKENKKLREYKKNFPSAMDQFDMTIDKQYKEIITDIEDMQYELWKADKKKAKKDRKKIKKGKIAFYSGKSKKARTKAANRLVGSKWFDTIKSVIEEIKPIAVIIMRLLAALITAILSIDQVKKYIKPDTLEKIDGVYRLCVAFK